jgi:hypothetical protein
MTTTSRYSPIENSRAVARNQSFQLTKLMDRFGSRQAAGKNTIGHS